MWFLEDITCPFSLSLFLCTSPRCVLSTPLATVLTIRRCPLGMVTARYSIPALPPALARSRVSHKLQLSSREKVKLRLTLFALCVASFTTCLLLLTNVVSPLERFATLRDEYHSRDVISGLNKPSSIAKEPLSSYWAYYSPYHPAHGKFEGSTRGGCVVSQVNIVSSFLPVDRSHCRSITLTHLPPASAPRSPIPDFQSGQCDCRSPWKTSSRYCLRRSKVQVHEKILL